MQENRMILSECEEINVLLYKPIATTRRIKYTCLNVSINYIVLGSTSGSLYLFTRKPCTFHQLIPLSEGAVTRVVISPDEKTIALATENNRVCLIAVKPSVKLLATSSEHVTARVTSLCWNHNSSEIYIGDDKGKISSMILSIFTVNGMFQAPFRILLHVDSAIVQMQFWEHVLLVSSMSRCYICDTMNEQFKQIGNKAHGGEYGACILEDDSSFEAGANLPEAVKGNDAKNNKNAKIYCARPGCRLWEVTSCGKVAKTHQFKDAFAVLPARIYRANNVAIPPKSRPSEKMSLQQSVRFSRLHIICGKYLFSYTRDTLCVIDPTNASVVVWNREFGDIRMARTMDDRIYLMQENGTFHCLRLSTNESLILELYEDKNYAECLRACETLKPELLKHLNDGKVHKEKSVNTHEKSKSSSDKCEIEMKVAPIISQIQASVRMQPIKMNSGIVIVNSGDSDLLHRNGRQNYQKSSEKNGSDQTVTKNSQDSNTQDDGDKILNVCNDNPVFSAVYVNKAKQSMDNDQNTKESQNSSILTPKVAEKDSGNTDTIEESANIKEITKSMSETTLSAKKIPFADFQTDLNPANILINSLKTSMGESEIENVIINVKKTISDIKIRYENDMTDFVGEILSSTERCYYHKILETISSESLMNMRNDLIIEEIFRAFTNINFSWISECPCGYYYPENTKGEPKFRNIGVTLLEKFALDNDHEKCVQLCNKITPMWRYYLPKFNEDSQNIDEIFCMCIRTRDHIVLSIILPMLDTEQWEKAAQCIKEVESGICPCCGRMDENSMNLKKFLIDWGEVAHELLNRTDFTSTVNFFMHAESILPDVRLDKSIFQSQIFTGILSRYGHNQVVDFAKNESKNDMHGTMCSDEVQSLLINALEKDLARPLEKDVFGKGAHHWGMRLQEKLSTCPCCMLSLQTPILLRDNGISVFPCGHAYHVNCLIEKQLTKCNLHQ